MIEAEGIFYPDISSAPRRRARYGFSSWGPRRVFPTNVSGHDTRDVASSGAGPGDHCVVPNMRELRLTKTMGRNAISPELPGRVWPNDKRGRRGYTEFLLL